MNLGIIYLKIYQLEFYYLYRWTLHFVESFNQHTN